MPSIKSVASEQERERHKKIDRYLFPHTFFIIINLIKANSIFGLDR